MHHCWAAEQWERFFFYCHLQSTQLKRKYIKKKRRKKCTQLGLKKSQTACLSVQRAEVVPAVSSRAGQYWAAETLGNTQVLAFSLPSSSEQGSFLFDDFSAGGNTWIFICAGCAASRISWTQILRNLTGGVQCLHFNLLAFQLFLYKGRLNKAQNCSVGTKTGNRNISKMPAFVCCMYSPKLFPHQPNR